jgi:endonuclease YncB( thermonuclease family)
MKVLSLTIVLCCCVLLSPVLAWEGYVIKVIDGDSLRVKAGRQVTEIRLYGIDAPEWGQEYGNKAKQALKRKINRKKVTVVQKDIDRYGRTVALVSSSSGLVNREMVKDGFAWMYPKYCRQQPLCSELKALEQRARSRRIGLWRGKNPISPWQWKWKYKKRKH